MHSPFKWLEATSFHKLKNDYLHCTKSFQEYAETDLEPRQVHVVTHKQQRTCRASLESSVGGDIWNHWGRQWLWPTQPHVTKRTSEGSLFGCISQQAHTATQHVQVYLWTLTASMWWCSSSSYSGHQKLKSSPQARAADVDGDPAGEGHRRGVLVAETVITQGFRIYSQLSLPISFSSLLSNRDKIQDQKIKQV